MINKKFNNLIQDLESIKMTRDEKHELKNRVFRSINLVEEVLEADSLAPVSSVPSTYFETASAVQKTVVRSWYTYFAEKKFVPAFVALFVLLSSGGLSMAAEQSLPGDLLYSLKVNVNESVRGLAALTPEAKAKLALEVTDRRLKEAALLSIQGRLDEHASGIIQEQLVRQAGEVKNQVASLVSVKNLKAAQEIALSYESALKTHEFILQKLSDEKVVSTEAPTSKSDHISTIIAAGRTELATTTTSRASLQTEELATASVQTKEEISKRLADLRIKISDTIKSAQVVQLTEAASTTVGLYIGQAADLSQVAGVNIDLGEFPVALTAIQKATQYMSDAEAILSTSTIYPKNDKDISAVIQSALTSSTTLPISTIGTATTTVATSTATTTESVSAETNSTSTPNQVK